MTSIQYMRMTSSKIVYPIFTGANIAANSRPICSIQVPFLLLPALPDNPVGVLLPMRHRGLEA